jgi:hypothetical protein
LAQGRVKALWRRSASHLDEGGDGGEKLIVALTMTQCSQARAAPQ